MVMHIFISHTSEDDPFVALLAARLVDEGFTVWTDSEINRGVPWADAIEKAIRDSSSVVVVLTPESCKSAYVTFEWAFAWGSGKALLPLLIRDCDLHPRLKLIQYLDFRKPDSEDWSRLFQDLRQPSSPPGFSLARQRPAEVEAMIAGLASPSATDRIEAVKELTLYNHSTAEEAVIEALTSPFFDVRFEAALSRTYRGDERALRPLLEGMRASDIAIRQKARAGFLKLSIALVGPSIADFLHSGPPQSAAKTFFSRLKQGSKQKLFGKGSPSDLPEFPQGENQ